MSNPSTDSTTQAQSPPLPKAELWGAGSLGPNRTPIGAVDIAPHGDLILEARKLIGIARFKVVSAILCLASPVFRAMLGPNSSFKEARELRNSETPNEPHIISLSGTDPQALAVVLYALHLQTDKVPRSVSFENLYKLAVICDKYDCANAVSLWVPIWTKAWEQCALLSSFEKWLFIAWTFRMEGVFTKISRKFILEGHYTIENGRFLTKEDFVALDPRVPESIVKEILQRRSSAIRALPELALSFLQRYNTPGVKSRCSASTPVEQCDMMILGSTLKAFQALGIQPTYDKLLLQSIKSLHSSLKEVKIHFLEVLRKPCHLNAFTPNQCSIHGSVTGCGSALVSHESTCSFVPEFILRLDAIVSNIKGLSLYDFPSRQMHLVSPKGGEWESIRYICI